MRPYRTLQFVVTLGIFGYVATAFGVQLTTGRTDLYPVFSWDLFSRIPNEYAEYELRVKDSETVGESVLERVRRRRHGRGVWRLGPRDRVGARMWVMRLARGIEEGDASAIEEARSHIEAEIIARRTASAASELGSRSRYPSFESSMSEHSTSEFSAAEFSYRLVRVSYDPLEKYRTGQVRERVELAAFQREARP